MPKNPIITTLILCVLAFSIPLDGAASSSSAAPSPAALPALKSNHAQLLMLLDNSEMLGEQATHAVTISLMDALEIQDIPITILVSYWTLRNYLGRVLDGRIATQGSIKNFDIYPLGTKTDLILMVPKTLPSSTPLNLTGLTRLDLDDYDKPEGAALWHLVKIKKDKRIGIFFNKAVFSNLFMPDTDTIWDICITGHGNDEGTIVAGTTPTNLITLLNFFNTHLRTGTVYLQSCYLGGTNINKVQFERFITQKYLAPLTFILIVNGVLDDVVDEPGILEAYFLAAAAVTDKNKTLNNLLKTITDFSQPRPNIPQVWLPGGMGFQTFNIDNQVLSIGKIKAQIAQKTGEALTVPTSIEAVLIYPYALNATLNIIPGEKTKLPHQYPPIKFIDPQLHFAVQPSELYPRIIPMTQERPRVRAEQTMQQYIQAIHLTTPVDESIGSGIAGLLMNAFKPIHGIDNQEYYLTSITGPNDFPDVIQMLKTLRATYVEKHGAAGISFTTHIDQEAELIKKVDMPHPHTITIQYVKIRFVFSGEGILYAHITFIYNDALYEIQTTAHLTDPTYTFRLFNFFDTHFSLRGAPSIQDPQLIKSYIQTFQTTRNALQKRDDPHYKTAKKQKPLSAILQRKIKAYKTP